MDLYISFAFVFMALLWAVIKNITILYPLLFGLFLFFALAYRKGFKAKALVKMILDGVKRPAKIYTITLLVGAASSGWMAAGTIPFFIKYGINYINPQLFVVSIFVMTCLISMTLGSSFGTTGVIGVVFIAMAKAGHINPNLAAGALISAAYFGERATPLSSCANLVAILTDTDLYKNLKQLFVGTWIPLTAATLLYLFFSLTQPLHADFNGISIELQRLYVLNPIVAIPTVLVFICVLFRLDVRIALSLSLASAFVIGVVVQHLSPASMAHHIVFGFQRTSTGPLATILKSGGMMSMLKAMLVVMTAAGYTGLFDGTQMLSELQRVVDQIAQKTTCFVATLITALAGACFGCSQTFAIMTAHQFMKSHYTNEEHEKTAFAEDLGNTAVVIAPLVPWNVGAAIPAAILGVGVGYMPYAFYLYLIPLFMLWKKRKITNVSL